MHGKSSLVQQYPFALLYQAYILLVYLPGINFHEKDEREMFHVLKLYSTICLNLDQPNLNNFSLY